MHTAVKIAPNYFTPEHPALHVLDASRAVVVVSSLLDVNTARRTEYVAEQAELYAELREEHYASLEDRKFLPLDKARARGLKVDWAAKATGPVPTTPWAPAALGVTTVESQDLASLLPYFDWAPFFAVWELRGKYPNRGYPKIFDDADVGAEAKKLFADAQAMLKEIIDGKWLTARGVVGIFPANAVGDDVRVFPVAAATVAPGAPGEPAPVATFRMLRQQAEKENDDAYLALSDFVAPAASGVRDFVGAFAVGVFGGEEQMADFAKVRS